MSFFRAAKDGLSLNVRVSPKASRDAILGVMATPDGAALKIAVRAPPDKGKANGALAAVIAKAFRIPTSQISVLSGEFDRRKVLRLTGDPAALAATAGQWKMK